MNKYNLKRARPERSEKRKIVSLGSKSVDIKLRVSAELKEEIAKEASDLGVSENLYLNAVIESRNLGKVKKLMDEK